MRNPSRNTIKWLNRNYPEIVDRLMCSLPCSDIDVYKIAIGEVHDAQRIKELLSPEKLKLVRIQ